MTHTRTRHFVGCVYNTAFVVWATQVLEEFGIVLKQHVLSDAGSWSPCAEVVHAHGKLVRCCRYAAVWWDRDDGERLTMIDWRLIGSSNNKAWVCRLSCGNWWASVNHVVQP